MTINHYSFCEAVFLVLLYWTPLTELKTIYIWWVKWIWKWTVTLRRKLNEVYRNNFVMKKLQYVIKSYIITLSIQQDIKENRPAEKD